MNEFVDKHREKITGTLSCFDRIIFKGHLPINYPAAMESFLYARGVLLKDFKSFVPRLADRLKAHAEALATKAGRPYRYLSRPERKQEQARAIARCDDITEGLVCVLSAIEPCGSFRIAYGKGRPRIVMARRKCLFLYFYYLDPKLGFIHVRIQTWFPFTVQVYINGHDWLARKMDKCGLGYRAVDNAFTELDDPERSQRLADRLPREDWPRILNRLVRKVNPLLNDLLKPLTYYWVIDQAEYATDLLFKDRQALQSLYPRLLRYATLSFTAEDILTFLGRKLHPQFAGEVLNDYKKRWPGARVKHRMKENWIKMYDKHGCVLRIETVINRPYEFRVRRLGRRQGRLVMGWYYMAKGVANIYRYAQVSRSANNRYLNALAVVDDPARAQQSLRKFAAPVRHNGRNVRGFNPVSQTDVALFRAVLRGDHAIMGLRNRDLRQALELPSRRQEQMRRSSARVSRILKRLHVHRLIAKVPRSRRWRPTKAGYAFMSLAIRLHDQHFPEELMKAA